MFGGRNLALCSSVLAFGGSLLAVGILRVLVEFGGTVLVFVGTVIRI